MRHQRLILTGDIKEFLEPSKWSLGMESDKPWFVKYAKPSIKGFHEVLC